METPVSYIQGEQRKIVRIITKRFKSYYLTGGTALAFYFGHRFSEDLDFFTQEYRKGDPDRIMDFISKETGFDFWLEAEQEDPGLIPMKVFFLELKTNAVLKIDFVRDFEKNLKVVKNGLHSLEDIYCRKVIAAIGYRRKENLVGKVIAAGRQTTKDLFDLYYLSSHHLSLSDFFLEYFSMDKVESLVAWYRGFSGMKVKLELMDLVSGVDTAEVFRHLDDEILRKLPDKVLG